MLAYLVLLIAVLSRFIPHAMHGVGLNFTAVGGGLLFFGARRSRWQAGFAVLAMAASDVVLTRVVYGYPFHLRSYLLTWAWYAGVCLLARGVLQTITAGRVAGAVFSSATSFFVLSNFAVWFGGALYPHSVAGLLQCYEAAVPFYANDLISTTLTAAVLFGLPVVASELLAVWRRAVEQQRPLL